MQRPNRRRAKQQEIGVALATIFTFITVGLVVYPSAGAFLGQDQTTFLAPGLVSRFTTRGAALQPVSPTALGQERRKSSSTCLGPFS
jgi:hypothetical protein